MGTIQMRFLLYRNTTRSLAIIYHYQKLSNEVLYEDLYQQASELQIRSPNLFEKIVLSWNF